MTREIKPRAVKPGVLSAQRVGIYLHREEDAEVINRWMREEQAKRNSVAAEAGTTAERVTSKDALQNLLYDGMWRLKDSQRDADRMAARKVLGHKWCKHTNSCGGILTAPDETAQREHLRRSHLDLYNSEMTRDEVDSHFKPMEDTTDA